MAISERFVDRTEIVTTQIPFDCKHATVFGTLLTYSNTQKNSLYQKWQKNTKFDYCASKKNSLVKNITVHNYYESKLLTVSK